MESQIEVLNSKPEDIETIFEFYDMAVAHQKKVFNKHWQGFSRELVQTEIAENRQYKILINDEVAGIFAVTFNDPEIWEEKDAQRSIYIHRIVTHPNFRGYGIVNLIIEWAKEYAQNNQIEFIRMDTWADNEKLLAEARAERDTMMKEAREIKEKMINDAKAEAQVQGEKMIEQAKASIASEKNAAIADLKNQVGSLSLEIAEKVLRGELANKETQTKLVEQMLGDAKLN